MFGRLPSQDNTPGANDNGLKRPTTATPHLGEAHSTPNNSNEFKVGHTPRTSDISSRLQSHKYLKTFINNNACSGNPFSIHYSELRNLGVMFLEFPPHHVKHRISRTTPPHQQSRASQGSQKSKIIQLVHHPTKRKKAQNIFCDITKLQQDRNKVHRDTKSSKHPTTKLLLYYFETQIHTHTQ